MVSQVDTYTIMVVDDIPENLSLMVEILGRAGYNVTAFPHGTMALRAALNEPPDLILLDIMMPDIDGFEVCRQLKLNNKLMEIPVIFLSALDDTQNIVRAFSEGGLDYITKPFHKEEILARVNTHLKLRSLHKKLEEQNKHLEDLIQEKVREISESQLATIIALSKLAESRDDETGKHIDRTCVFCRILAEKLRENPQYKEYISDSFIDNIYYAATMHDIGKVGIPDKILLKPGKLTEEEFEIMKTHVLIGAKTLEALEASYPNNAFIRMGISLTKFHHEKWDGTGYPAGLKGEEIPLSGRIMAMADVYDALRSTRPYKEAFSHEKSVRLIKEGSGTHFDPALVEAFLSLESDFASISLENEEKSQC